jgi:uncharacterized protein (DUF4415 family)
MVISGVFPPKKTGRSFVMGTVKSTGKTLPKAGKKGMYKPVKVVITCRLDADVVAWLKREGKGYQTRINALLRNAMGNAKTV